jgi:hypothetical protein
MPDLVIAVIASLFRALRSRRDLVLENLALRHQLAVLNRTARHKRLSNADRFFWAVLSRWWHRWKDALVIVRPDTVIRWHRTAFRAYWTRKSKKSKPGRPRCPRKSAPSSARCAKRTRSGEHRASTVTEQRERWAAPLDMRRRIVRPRIPREFRAMLVARLLHEIGWLDAHVADALGSAERLEAHSGRQI